MGADNQAALERDRRARLALRVVRVIGGAAVIAVAVGVVTAVAAPAKALPAAPDFSVPALGPGRAAVTKADRIGHVTVLAFWASWCEPCRQELPGLAAALPGTELVGIDTNDTRSDGLRFLSSLHLDLNSGFDDSAAVATAFRLPGLPATVILSSSGRVVARYLGPAPIGQLRQQVQRAARRS